MIEVINSVESNSLEVSALVRIEVKTGGELMGKDKQLTEGKRKKKHKIDRSSMKQKSRRIK